jgi:hypothetical protein
VPGKLCFVCFFDVTSKSSFYTSLSLPEFRHVNKLILDGEGATCLGVGGG